MNYESLLREVCPKGKASVIEGFASALPKCIELADLTTDLRLAHYLAQCCHESDGLNTTVEYASGAAYEGRRDLGNIKPGDGVRFKGRGLIQVTGRSNYARYGTMVGADLIGQPTLAALFPEAALTAAAYWRDRGINKLADKDDIIGATRAVNGGLNGLDSRKAYLSRAKVALKGQIVAKAPSSPVQPLQPSTASIHQDPTKEPSVAISVPPTQKTGLFAWVESLFTKGVQT